MTRAKEWLVASLEGLLDDPGSLARRLALQALFQDMPPIEEAIRLTLDISSEEVRDAAAAVLRPEAGRLFLQGPRLEREERDEVRATLRQYARGT